MLLDVRPDHFRMVSDILQKHVPQYEVWAFGSRTKWTAKDHSDLDLCVVSDKPLSFSVMGAMAEDFSDSDLPWKVDVVDWATTSASFRKIIERDKVVVKEAKRGGSLADVRETLPLIGKLPINWKISRFGDVLEGGVRNGIYKQKEFHGRGAKVVNMGELFAHPRLRNVPMKRVQLSETDIEKSLLKTGDLLFARRSLVAEGAGKCIVVCEVEEPTTFESSIIRARPNAKTADSMFLYYLFNSPYGTHVLRTILRQVAVSGITGGDLVELPIPLPPLPEQKAIAHILGMLDDKIELNRRMNATLEAMARALFQSWFVDFDPVRAKLDGRKLAGLDDATAALFPAHFQDSPLGHIPQGWKAGPLSEGFNLTMGQSPPGNTYNEDGNGIPLYQGRTGFGFRFPTRRIYCTAPTRYAKPGDTLVSVRAPVGDINMANEECCIGRGVAAVRHKSGAVSFTYHAMENLSPDFALFEGEGTVFGSINKQNFENLRFVMPPPEIVASYEQLAKPLNDQISTLEHQSRTLATIRDALLPKLLSGELSVVNIEEKVASV